MKLITTISITFACYVTANVPKLDLKNYASKTEGKTVFLKYFAPWCGHCKKMARDWEMLAEEWTNDENGLVAEIDCTSHLGKPLCEQHGVDAYPTIKYGDPTDLKDYEFKKLSFIELSAFAKDKMTAVCSPSKLYKCDDERKAFLEKYMAMDDVELEDFIEAEEDKVVEIEKKYKVDLMKLDKRYESWHHLLIAEKEEALAKLIDIDLLKSIRSYNEKKEWDGAKVEL